MTRTLPWTEHDWQNPPSIYRSAPFWSWNERLVPERLCRQIRQMYEAGMGGFFMHSRYGLKTAYLSDAWFECVTACVEQARALGMKAYLYDEDRWPSGAAGGLVTRDRAEFGAHLLAAIDGDGAPDIFERLGTFAVRTGASGRVEAYRAMDDGERPADAERAMTFAAGPVVASAWFNEAPYLDVLSADAVAEFIRVTHQAYADRYGKDFGDLIPGIFTDEPQYFRRPDGIAGAVAALPWTATLPMTFRKRRGYDLRDHLPELVLPTGPDAASGFSKVRHDYWLTVTELFVENFSRQIGAWCERNHIALTGHYNAEETLFSQITNIGAAMPNYAHQQWPGIDILTDLPGRDRVATSKQCSSVAEQMGRQRVLSELYGCTGWDWPLEGHKYNGGWQFVLGVNFRCPHLSWYSMAGGAKRDYPASIFPHSPWWKYYHVVEDYFGRLGVVLTAGQAVRDVLVIHPIESAYGLLLTDDRDSVADLQKPFDALLNGLLDGHYDYDLGDESLLADQAKATAGKLKVGRMTYRLVVVPPCVTLRATTVALLKRLVASGGAVLFAGRRPERVDGAPSGDLADLLAKAETSDADPSAVIAAIERQLPRRVSVTEAGAELGCVWTHLRQVAGGQVLFLQSCDRQAAHDVRVTVQARQPVVLMDAMTGARRRLAAEADDGSVAFDLHLPATGSAVVSLGIPAGDAAAPAGPETVVASARASGPWAVQAGEDNVLPLDYCRWRIGDAALSDPVPVLLAEEKIREHFGLPTRAARGCQPWYLAQTGRADREVRGRAEMRFAFHVTDVPGALQVAVEGPGDFEIALNGQAVSNVPTGWWVDEDLKTVDLSPAVRAGDNELVLAFDYRSDMELEDLHLIGDFGVRQRGAEPTFDAYTLVAASAELSAGSWVGQGLDFYGGAVTYRLAVPDEAAEAVAAGKRVRLALPDVKCTCAALHVGTETFVLPWAPMAADITDALRASGVAEIGVEVIGGRHNTFGPLHCPWMDWTGPEQFDPHFEQWTDLFVLNDHGLMAEPVFEILR